MKLSFYTPIAYDFKFSVAAIFSYYDIADEILLPIDKGRISWNMMKYDFNQEEFSKNIKELDKDNKIKIVEENFHLFDDPIQNDTFERNFVSKICKKENYIIGIDSDEILLNPKEFFNWISEDKKEFDIQCEFYNIYKTFDKMLLIAQPKEYAVVGTDIRDGYSKCRITKNKLITSPLKILHYSWGRRKDEIIDKLINWGHALEFNIDKYLSIWEDVNLNNYKTKNNLHPLGSTKWLSLELFNLDSFNLSNELLKKIQDFSKQGSIRSKEKMLKLNLGCGKDIKQDYINIDVNPKSSYVIKGNVTKLDFSDETIDEIFLSHVIEHLNNREIRPALKEWNRILKKQGKLIIITPNVIGAVKAFISGTLDTSGFSKNFKNWSPEEVVFQMIYGRADIFGDNEHESQQHRTGFSYNRINRFLKECGFKIYKANDTTDTNQDLIIEAVKFK